MNLSHNYTPERELFIIIIIKYLGTLLPYIVRQRNNFKPKMIAFIIYTVVVNLISTTALLRREANGFCISCYSHTKYEFAQFRLEKL